MIGGATLAVRFATMAKASIRIVHIKGDSMSISHQIQEIFPERVIFIPKPFMM